MKCGISAFIITMLCATLFISVCTGADTGSTTTITDIFDRSVTIPSPLKEVVCSGSSLRYLVYLQAQDLAVGVDSIEKSDNGLDARGYALVNPQFKDLPLFGEYRGKDDPEKIIAIGPQAIFKYGDATVTPAKNVETMDTLSEKSKTPVIGLLPGSFTSDEQKKQFYDSLRIMGKATGKEARAEELISYMDELTADLNKRTSDIPEAERKTAYIGGVSYAGAHGIISTEPAYPPFLWINAKNVAGGRGNQHADIAKEALVEWDPECLFIDIGTIQMDNEGAIGELKNDASLKGLSAVKNGKVYGVLPYNWYTTNWENAFADAYYIGKILYPDKFTDVDPDKKAEEISAKFLGKSAYSTIKKQYKDLPMTQLKL